MKKTITSLTLCAFFSISHAQEVTTLTIDEKGHFVLTIPYLEFETEDGKQAFSAKLYSSTAATFEVDFESVQKVALQDNDSDNDFPTAFDECEVLSIYDGDTMTLQCSGNPEKTKVRLYCIDTPEMKQEPWGTQARDYLRSITGNMVKLVELDKDIYERIVGEVYSGNVNLNLAQVKAGKAAVYDAYCENSEYKAAEKEAIDAKLGIWSEPGLHQTPWEWRKQEREG
jgi:endonuclease YncB( thermonuclease family)